MIGLSSPGGGVRERTMQAVEYYNNTVLRARVGAGLTSSPRSPTSSYQQQQDALHRSNSSLELTHDPHDQQLRREYGSHGSIDVISNSGGGSSTGAGESFFAMLQDYRPAVLSMIGTDQRSPGPAEYLRGKVDPPPATENASNALAAANDDPPSSGLMTSSLSTSPKLRLKLHRFWGGSGSAGGLSGGGSGKPPRHQHVVDDSVVNTSSSGVSGFGGASEVEERQRRRAFAHYDCQSITANLGYAAKLRGILLARRRNTTTGASAASMLGARSATPDGADSGDEDSGDGLGNDLLESCPFFRNEIGGEEERVVSLMRGQSPQNTQRRPLHRPPMAYGVSVLEFPPGETHWRQGTCPYQRHPRAIESVDQGARYYRNYFYGQEHQNWFGMDENLGPVAVSIRRERLERPSDSSSGQSQHTYQYRLLIRTSELLTLRGSVLEDCIPNLKSSSSNKTLNTKEVLEYVAPEIQLSCLRLGIVSQQTEDQLLKLDEQGLTNHYKVGVMYCRTGQSSEEEMYNNEDSGPAFHEFLDTIGQRVRLKGFDKYRAGLDNKTDSTGLYSVYAQYQDCEIMFHVSTLLPFTPNNRQQLLRKRHIGNDIVTIVFQEPGAQPFTPKNIRSQFQHVFIVVRAINPCTENTQYRVAVSRSKEVPVFGPPIHEGATFPKSKAFADFLLAKVINAENAAHRSEKFATMATRTRQEYLKDLANNYTTTTVVDPGQKFSIKSFSSKKKERARPRFLPDALQRGAVSWQVVLDDSGQSALVDCYLGISTDTLVLIEEQSREIVFVMPCKAILGWSAQTNSLRVYHHQGECTTLHMREGGDRDELMEIVVRLRAVTSGCVAQELSLQRNPMGQLGFHVQPDGVVTQVEIMGLAWQAGLRQGARLVEICKVAVSTLSYDQMVDLLKTSMLVTVTVIPPLPDGTPRRGCSLQNCRYTLGNYEGDYENVSGGAGGGAGAGENKTGHNAAAAVPGKHRRRYERSFSPPRSSNSSGYGTGSSSKSFTDTCFSSNLEGTMTSSSSGHSSDDRWYELLELAEPDVSMIVRDSPPPPLPARLGSGGGSAFQQVPPKQLGSKHPIQATHSLPLSTTMGNFSLPPTTPPRHCNISQVSGGEYEAAHHEFKLGEKVTCLKSAGEVRAPNRPALDYLTPRTPKISDYSSHQNAVVDMIKSSSLPPDCATSCRGLGINDSHSTDTSSTSERPFGGASEDELSAGSSNVSPRLRRSAKHHHSASTTGTSSVGGGTLTPSSGSSRNQSPRPKDTGEARLRPGVTARNSSNRNSANLTGSTLQEDLMRLINPDYMAERDEKNKESTGSNIGGKVHSSSSNNISGTGNETTITIRSRSRENLCSSGNNGPSLSVLPASQTSSEGDQLQHGPDQHNKSSSSGTEQGSSEVILTLARPATVISNASTASSPAPSENKLTKEERLSPRVTKSSPGAKLSEPLPLPDAREMDWPSLVDTATRAMLQVQRDDPIPEAARNGENLGHWVDDVAERLGLDTTTSKSKTNRNGRHMTELQEHLVQLEARVARETRRRLSLEEEVRHLRDENKRLQEQCQTAAQQIRTFTEWLFQRNNWNNW